MIRDYNANSPFFTSGIDRSISIVNGDLADYSTLERAVNEYEIDTVFHLAAQAIVGVANKNPIQHLSNIKGTWNILEACRNTDRVSRIVVASSDKAYGSQKNSHTQKNAPSRESILMMYPKVAQISYPWHTIRHSTCRSVLRDAATCSDLVIIISIGSCRVRSGLS